MNYTYFIDPEKDQFDVVVRVTVRVNSELTDLVHRCGNAKVRPSVVITMEYVHCLTCGSQMDLYSEEVA
ncbi:hypothetical protein SEA_SCHWARTZ33_81 [Gordonia phage Schwartz33]|nr:hypothetical protein SEA_SCHWARTZ33_81 [Gordonia phage Schwartz33]